MPTVYEDNEAGVHSDNRSSFPDAIEVAWNDSITSNETIASNVNLFDSGADARASVAGRPTDDWTPEETFSILHYEHGFDEFIRIPSG